MNDIHHYTFGYNKSFSSAYERIFSKKRRTVREEREVDMAKKKKTYKGKSMMPGGGGQFAKMVDAMRAKGMSKTQAAAIAASMGRKKYGKAKFQKMAANGKKRAKKK